IYIGDILQATANKKIDSLLRIDSWDKDSIQKSYKSSLLYFSAMSGYNNPNVLIMGRRCYTIYNTASIPITLRIPAVSTQISSFVKEQKFLAKKENTGQWSLSLNSWDACHTSIGSVYLGENQCLSKEITSPVSLSFSQQCISIYDSNRSKTWGVVVSPKKSESGNYFEIIFENNASTAASIRAVIGEKFNIGRSQLVQWYDSEKDIWINAQDTINVSLKPKQRQIKIIAIGNEQYFRDLGSIVRKNILALRAVYPNPFTRTFNIQYSLPYDTKKVAFLLYDLLGKVAWNRDVFDVHPGPSLLKMDKRLATGLYVLQMKVSMEGSGTPKVLNRRVVCVK
ncbi:MAG TPA: hypothetical protein VHO70_02860, partial [Chitinispirillaceae bacterium]|nr:hypothetical protein [Chitinispirillaceae bacterium]